MKTNVWKLGVFALLLMLLWSCRKDDVILPVHPGFEAISGFYLLNEGQMDQNNATLDYYDFLSENYLRNVFTFTNPTVPLGLGDTGNDVAVYGSKLYAVINGSNKVEIMQLGNAKRIKELTINQPRFITFAGGKAYVSAYDGTDVEAGTARGMVVEIDTASLEITRKVLVGRQPEDLAVVGGKLYVANSGWADAWTGGDYEQTLSVIDLSTFTKVNDIDVAINLK